MTGFYCFKENEEYIVDPYAKAVTEREIFGIENKMLYVQVQLSLLITTGKGMSRQLHISL